MNFYLAASSTMEANRRYVAQVAAALELRGWFCTFAWWENFGDDPPHTTQELERMGIGEAQIVICLVDHRSKATWVEFGMAFGLGRRVLILTKPTSLNDELPWFVTNPRVRMTPLAYDRDPDEMADFIIQESRLCPVPLSFGAIKGECESCGLTEELHDGMCVRCGEKGRIGS